jgi:two-component system alkaline phosphatase synthesis response regulator PhoP
MKILIVEDEEALLDIFCQQLHSEKKYKVEVAKDGEEAIKKAQSFMPDVILLDIMLPKKDGIQVLQELKADPKTKNIVVIMSSNLSSDESIKKSLSLGAADYFVKSQHSVFEILEKVEKAMQ